MTHGSVDGGVGERGERLGHAHHVPHAADVGERDEQRGLRLHVAQDAHGNGLRDGGAHFGGSAIKALREASVRIGIEKRDQPVGIGSRRSHRYGEDEAIASSSARAPGWSVVSAGSAAPAPVPSISSSQSR